MRYRFWCADRDLRLEPILLASRNKIKILCMVGLIVCAAIVVLYDRTHMFRQEILSPTILVAVIIALFIQASTIHTGPWSASVIYAIVYAAFHFGATSVVALGAVDVGPNEAISRWIYSSYTMEALVLASLGFATFLVGVNTRYAFSPRKKFVDPPPAELSREMELFIAIGGFIVLTLGVSAWFLMVIFSAGAPMLFGSYGDYLTFASGGIAGASYYLISIGCPILLGCSQSKIKTWGVLLFGIWGTVALPLGLRGEVLFPLAVGSVVAVKRGFKVSSRVTILSILILLSTISAIREIRQVGIASLSSVAFSLNPAEGLAELGASLRPVYEVLRWRAAGESYLYGASYWAPIERLITLVVPYTRRIPGGEDERLQNVVVMQRVGPIGFSPVAESYRNFGILGVAVIMCLMGYIVASMDLWPADPWHNAIISVILVPLIIQIRNDFTPVPAQVFIGLVFLFSIRAVSRMVSGVTGRAMRFGREAGD